MVLQHQQEEQVVLVEDQEEIVVRDQVVQDNKALNLETLVLMDLEILVALFIGVVGQELLVVEAQVLLEHLLQIVQLRLGQILVVTVVTEELIQSQMEQLQFIMPVVVLLVVLEELVLQDKVVGVVQLDPMHQEHLIHITMQLLQLVKPIKAAAAVVVVNQVVVVVVQVAQVVAVKE